MIFSDPGWEDESVPCRSAEEAFERSQAVSKLAMDGRGCGGSGSSEVSRTVIRGFLEAKLQDGLISNGHVGNDVVEHGASA